MRVYVGLDWSAREVVCSTATDVEEPRLIKGAARTLVSVREFLDRVRARHGREVEIHVFIEVGAPGWVELFYHAGAAVHVADAKQAKAFAESLCSSGAKDDCRDSLVITQFGRERCDRLAIWSPRSDTSTELTELAWLHDKRTEACRKERQRLRSKLRETFPELESALKDLSLKWVAHLLRAIPTARHAAALSREEFKELMAGSGARRTSLDAVWKAIEPLEAEHLSENLARTRAFIVRNMVDEIQRQCAAIQELDQMLDAATEGLVERSLLESVGGIGIKMSNRLLELAFDGEVPSHRDEASIKLGASPVHRGSGKTKNGRPKGYVIMRRSADSRARATAYLLGRLATQHLPWARAKYAWDMAHNKKSAHSYRTIARSLLRILTAMLRSGEPYDDARYCARLKAEGVPWAVGL